MKHLAEAVNRVVSEIGFSGAVRIDDGDNARFSEAYGLTHRGFGLPNAIDTQFAIASGGRGLTTPHLVDRPVGGPS
jgi:hypothetical protein